MDMTMTQIVMMRMRIVTTRAILTGKRSMMPPETTLAMVMTIGMSI